MSDTERSFSFCLPVQFKYTEPFYSSIPVTWSDLEDCTVCLPCFRDTFTPPTGTKIVIKDGVIVQ